jgi:hypothetical protein
MSKMSFWVVALVLVVGATAPPVLANGYSDIRLELAGQPADIFVTAGVEQDIPLIISYRMLDERGKVSDPNYGTWGLAAGTVASGVTVKASSSGDGQSPPKAAVYIGSALSYGDVGQTSGITMHISKSAPTGLAVIELYSFSDENESLTKLRFIGVVNVYIQSGNSHPPTAFRMATTSANVSANSNWATIDSPYTNGNPDAVVLVTHNWGYPCGQVAKGNEAVPAFTRSIAAASSRAGFARQRLVPPGQLATNEAGHQHCLLAPKLCLYNNHPLGVWYTGSKWAVFNQDGAPMPVGTSFNVMVAGDREEGGQIHLATSSDTVRETVYVYQEALNANPNALLFVTPSLTPPYPGYGGSLNHNLVVSYNGSKRWTDPSSGVSWPGMNDIMMMDGASVPNGAAFNTKAIGSGDDSTAFVHVVATSNMPNTMSNYSWITPAITDPNAVIIVTPRADTGALWMNHPIGVWYNGSRWAIFNEDISSMHVGNAYNVLVPRPPEVH